MKQYKAKEVAAELGIKTNTLTKRVKTFLTFEKKQENKSHRIANALVEDKENQLFGRFRFTRKKGEQRDAYFWRSIRNAKSQ